jgi:2-polyprenyl-6-hydroxyphenyl methylase/3-demethylubiquinone-9 3-methyltransferase
MTKLLKERISVDDKEIEQFSRIADEWWDETGKFAPLHKINPVRLAFIRDHILARFSRDVTQHTPLHGISILDIGCGGGLVSEPLARLGAEMHGIDASYQNIQVASLHSDRMNVNVIYEQTTAEQLVSDKKQYNVVLALEIVEHVAHVEMFLESCASLVKPGGMLIISTLNRTMKSLAMAKIGAEYILRWLPRGTHDWRKFLRPSEIIMPLQDQGLQKHDAQGMIFNPLKNRWSMSSTDLDVNYYLVFTKPA